MKRLFRMFSLGTLAVMILAAWVMFAHHRSILVGSVKAVAEAGSLTTGRMALQPIRAQLTEYVQAANLAGDESRRVPLPMSLRHTISDLMRDSRVVRVKIYNRDGVVIFSTRPEQIGGHQEANPGFTTAMAGRVSVQLIYRDSFNAFDRHSEEDNLVQTYFPIQNMLGTPIEGVFEIYTDANALVVATERSELAMLAGTAVVIGCVYLALLLLAHCAGRTIEAQRADIVEKNAMLERLSQQSMRREEGERRKLASELHEGLAQSLSAVKIALESLADVPPDKRSEMISAVIPSLRSSIGHARSMAESLHPSGLSELGLGPTLSTMLREFEAAHRLVRIEQEIAIDEAAVPANLKASVYRVLAAVLEAVRRSPEVSRMRITLRTDGGELVLLLEDDVRLMAGIAQSARSTGVPGSMFSELVERVIGSNGHLAAVVGADGTPALRAAWAL